MKYLIFIVFIIISLSTKAQKEGNIWYFGQWCGIDFNTSPPSGIHGSELNTLEGCATICDKNGKLLFYTDGSFVWNKQHEIMQNGDMLSGHESSTQSALIVPRPGSDHLFYIFTTDACHDSLTNGFSYSIVDLAENDGFGLVKEKNINLIDTVAEKLTAIGDTANNLVWIVAHGYGNNNFYSFRINKDGVAPKPVVSSVGSVHFGTNADDDLCGELGSARGYMKISPAGDKIALGVSRSSLLEIFDFDSLTGKVTNPVTLSRFRNTYGVEFSPDGSKLYFSCDTGTWSTETFTGMIYQVDIDAGNSLDIVNSTELVGLNQETQLGFGALQLAPNGKIYVARPHTQVLDIINYPNQKGTACNYTNNAFVLTDTSIVRFGLPNFMQNFFFKDTLADFTFKNICLGQKADFELNLWEFIEAKWIFHDGDIRLGREVSYMYTDTGKHEVKLICRKRNKTDTVIHYISVYANPVVDIGKDTTLCKDSPLTIAAESGFPYYIWNTLDRTQSIAVKKSGEYYVEVRDSNSCLASDTIMVTFNPLPEFDLGDDKILCKGDSIKLSVDLDNTNFVWNNNSTQNNIIVKKSGTYKLIAKNEFNCLFRDSIKLSFADLPIITLGADTSICSGDSIVLSPGNGFQIYQWHDKSNNSAYIAKKFGSYSVDVWDDNRCHASAQISINMKENPPFCLGNDTTLCVGDSLQLIIPIEAEVYIWNTGQTTNTITVFSTGLFKAQTIQKNDCSRSDSLYVTFISPPESPFSDNIEYCQNEPESMPDLGEITDFKWHYNQTDNMPVDTSAWYKFDAENAFGCISTDSIFIEIYSPPVIDTAYLTKPDEIKVLASGVASPLSYSLNNAEISSNFIFSDLRNGSYNITVIDTNNCKVTTRNLIVDDYNLDIEFPNVFTPNSDASNNIFVINKIENEIEKIAIFNIKIYNRWGRKVHESNDILNMWNGKVNGSEAVPGVYFYDAYIKTKDGKSQTKKGYVYLFR